MAATTTPPERPRQVRPIIIGDAAYANMYGAARAAGYVMYKGMHPDDQIVVLMRAFTELAELKGYKL